VACARTRWQGRRWAWFYVGKGPTTITGTGLLTFAYNDGNNNYQDNNGGYTITIFEGITTLADDCDTSVVACADMHADCLTKVAACDLV
jgi:hypothetical protein